MIKTKTPSQLSIQNSLAKQLHTCRLSQFSRKSLKFFIKSPGDFQGLFLDIVFYDILKMQRFLDISRFLYSGSWQVFSGMKIDPVTFKNTQAVALLTCQHSNPGLGCSKAD